MNKVDFQVIFKSSEQPNQQQIQYWIDTVLENSEENTEIVVRIVDEQESAQLNENYRHRSGPTNILSFPFEAPEIEGFTSELLGDLVICAPVLEREAIEQQKNIFDHWAHIIVHGVLHLLGYDHIDETEAEEMENIEIALLKKMNINNPYITQVINQ